MRVITEIELRERYRKEPFTTFKLPAGVRLTPAAAQFLADFRITIVAAEKPADRDVAPEGFILQRDGSILAEKPEHLTHLHGRYLVEKSHPRIRFRGGVDRVEALLLESIIFIQNLGEYACSRHLQEVLELVRPLMPAEVKGQPMPEVRLFSFEEEELHDRSHQPHRYYRIQHFVPQPEHGPLMAKLNLIRTEIRTLEVLAVEAFYDQETGRVERLDIIRALNRLSSALYVLMCAYLDEQLGSSK